MVERTVIWSLSARNQLKRILEFWKNHNQSNVYPEKLLKLVMVNTKLISKTPESCPKTDFPDIQVFVMRHYSIFFRARDFDIIIVSFWDNRQNPKRLSKMLKNK